MISSAKAEGRFLKSLVTGAALVTQASLVFASADIDMTELIKQDPYIFSEGRFDAVSLLRPKAEYRVGNWSVHPLLSFESAYDDNIHREPKREENSDWIYTTRIGMRVSQGSSELEEPGMNAVYHADIVDFLRTNEQDRIDHVFTLSAQVPLGGTLLLGADDAFEKTADRPNSEATTLEKRYRNNAGLRCAYIRDTLGVEMGVRDIRDDYDTLQSQDKHEFAYSILPSIALSAKTELLGEYTTGQIRYDEQTTNSDSDYHQWLIGIQRQVSAKLSLLLKAGYKTTDYFANDTASFKGAVYTGTLTYYIRERSLAQVWTERNSEESAYSSNGYFDTAKIGIAFDHQITPRLFLNSGGAFERHAYPDVTREQENSARRRDSIINGYIGLRYEPKEWVIVELFYDVLYRDSNFEAFNYIEGTCRTKVAFLF